MKDRLGQWFIKKGTNLNAKKEKLQGMVYEFELKIKR